MHGIIPQLFDCWADPVAHLLLLKSSMIESFELCTGGSIVVDVTNCA